MQIEKNSRQMPKEAQTVRQKEYCDLLYAWLQCNSECGAFGRVILKTEVKYTKIEEDFTQTYIDDDGKVKKEKAMGRKTIAKYFEFLCQQGLVVDNEDDDFYLLPTMGQDACMLIEYRTLARLMHTFNRNAINIYIYLFNRYFAAGEQKYIVTMKQIKQYLGIATTTSSNNIIINDVMSILKQLGLMDFEVVEDEEGKSRIWVKWVRNKLPEV